MLLYFIQGTGGSIYTVTTLTDAAVRQIDNVAKITIKQQM